MKTAFDVPVTLVGHPFAAIGRGEDLRCAYRALVAAGLAPNIVNVYDGGDRDRMLEDELRPALARGTAGGIDIFCINGDEVAPVLAHLGARRAPSRYSIVIPQWELSKYPRPWASMLEKFDEVWAPSVFIQRTLAPVVNRTVTHLPGSTGVRLGCFQGRRYFRIPESAYAFLFAFDLRSYQERKNPLAVVSAFREVVRARPSRDIALVVKVAGSASRPEAAAALRHQLDAAMSTFALGRAIVIESDLTDTETKNLVRACDCFVSLHRGEGYGRFLAEAMLLGRPVIATAYSGNMDFMNADVACLVNYDLVSVPPEAYPAWEDQVWAAPRTDEAVKWMTSLVDDPQLGRAIGARASRHIRSFFSYRAIGVRYLERLNAILH